MNNFTLDNLTLDNIAVHIGYLVMIGLAGIVTLVFFGTIWWCTGLLGAKLFDRLRRIYSLAVISYWLDKLEKDGIACFEKAGKRAPPSST